MARQRAFLLAFVTFVAGIALGATVVTVVRPAPSTTAELTSAPSPSHSPSQSPTSGPSTRFWPSMAFDGEAGRVVLFGGSSSKDTGVLPGTVTTLLAETWTWSRSGWRQEHPAVSPPARRAGAMVYDPNSQHVLLRGGQRPRR